MENYIHNWVAKKLNSISSERCKAEADCSRNQEMRPTTTYKEGGGTQVIQRIDRAVHVYKVGTLNTKLMTPVLIKWDS